MSTTKFSDILTEVLPELPGVPDPLVQNAIRNTVIAFCNSSDIWRSWLDPVDTVATQPTYDIEPDSGTDLVTLLSVKLDGRKLNARNEDDLDNWNPRWRTEVQTPQFYMQQDQDTVTLACVPECSLAGGLLLSVSLQPTRSSTSFPGWIYSQYWQGINDGVKARLMVMPGMAWSNPKMGLFYQASFDAEAANARADASRSLVRARSVSRSNH